MSKDVTPATEGELLIYPARDGVRVLLSGETVRLPQRQIADLYGVTVKTVSEHLQNVYEEGELQPERTIRKFRIVQAEGDRSVRRQYDAFAEQRRLEAEQAAEARYVEDLRSAADAVKSGKRGVRKPPAKRSGQGRSE